MVLLSESGAALEVVKEAVVLRAAMPVDDDATTLPAMSRNTPRRPAEVEAVKEEVDALVTSAEVLEFIPLGDLSMPNVSQIPPVLPSSSASSSESLPLSPTLLLRLLSLRRLLPLLRPLLREVRTGWLYADVDASKAGRISIA